LDSFIERQLDKKENPHPEAGFLRVAHNNGNLQALMERSMPCLNREGFSDYLLSNHGRGFGWYKSEADVHYPMTLAELTSLRIKGRKIELDKLSSYQKLNSI
jgi:hypothetical protein